MSETTIPAGWLLDALLRQRDMEAVDDGIRAAVRGFYADYTEAEALDPAFAAALERVSEYGDADSEDLVAEVERELHGRTGRFFTGLNRDDIDDEESDEG